MSLSLQSLIIEIPEYNQIKERINNILNGSIHIDMILRSEGFFAQASLTNSKLRYITFAPPFIEAKQGSVSPVEALEKLEKEAVAFVNVFATKAA